MKKLFYLLIVLLSFSFVYSSCTDDKKEENIDRQKAHSLYCDLLTMYRTYSDSLASVNDSATFDSILFRLDKNVKKIYSAYPADLDFKITESENDTLWQYVKKIAEARSRIVVSVKPDSLSTDSLPTDYDRAEKNETIKDQKD